MKFRDIMQCVLVIFILSSRASGAERVPISDDFSRDQLALYAQTLEGGKRAYPREFHFPEHAVEGKVFGIDVSHYQGKIDWTKVAGQGVSFVYVKATQGGNAYDSSFESNWNSIGKLRGAKPLRRGAYHFMTAMAPADEQASNYIDVVGKLDDEDLPPCIDVEWDFIRDKKGNRIDQWAKLKPAEIVEKIQAWLTKVEASTGKKPIIYTNASWWNARVGDSSHLDGYKVWIADYTSKSLGREAPVTPKRLNWSFWQMTDKGTVKAAGIKSVDTTVLNGKQLFGASR
jgi:lysozyme